MQFGWEVYLANQSIASERSRPRSEFKDFDGRHGQRFWSRRVTRNSKEKITTIEVSGVRKKKNRG
jgi:hypothetical protein